MGKWGQGRRKKGQEEEGNGKQFRTEQAPILNIDRVFGGVFLRDGTGPTLGPGKGTCGQSPSRAGCEKKKRGHVKKIF